MTSDDHGTPRVQEPKVSEAFPEVFHYTSVAALKGMLQTNELWATSIRHLNDSSEMEMIWPLIEKRIIDYLDDEYCSLVRAKPELKVCLSEMGGSDQVAAKNGRMLTSLMQRYFLGLSGEEIDREPPFVTSFTTHWGDGPEESYCRRSGMLSQWRAYGGCDGVAVVFDTRGLEELLAQEGEEFEYWPIEFMDTVYYEEGLSPWLRERMMLRAFPLLEGPDKARAAL